MKSGYLKLADTIAAETARSGRARCRYRLRLVGMLARHHSVWRRRQLLNAIFDVGGSLNKRGCELRIGSGLGHFEQHRGCLAREVMLEHGYNVRDLAPRYGP